jgi:hypothetical protein
MNEELEEISELDINEAPVNVNFRPDSGATNDFIEPNNHKNP